MKVKEIKKHLRVILTDLMVVHQEDSQKFISYSRNTSGYNQKNRLEKIWLSSKYIVFVADWLEQNGYIENHIGFYDRITKISRLSRMRAAQKLLNMFSRHKQPGGVILRRQPPIKMRDTKKREVWFPTEKLEIKQMIKNVNRINKVLAEHELKLDLDKRFCTDEQKFDLQLYFSETATKYIRIFNNNDFGQGGRFYCHWSQLIHKESRKHIQIDGIDTVECDYSCLHISMLYGLEKLNPPTGDLYQIEGISPTFRKLIKKSVNICINAENETKAKQAIHEECRNFEADTGLIPPRPTEIIDAIYEKHEPIKNYFCKQYGVKLQNIDSHIAEQILMFFAKKHEICLSIHDSFIVKHFHKEVLIKLMKQYFFDIFNFYPDVKIS